MKSYASIDRIEEKLAICEVEIISIYDSKTADYSEKETKMIDISLEKIQASVGSVKEGDILIVEYNGKEVIEVYYKDDEEKQRRIAIIKELL